MIKFIEFINILLGQPCILGLSILTNFGKIERTYHLPFQGGSKTTCVNGKVPPTKKFTCVTKPPSLAASLFTDCRGEWSSNQQSFDDLLSYDNNIGFFRI